MLSTGSPLAHEGFDYVYRCFKSDLCLSSISGGTDIVSCFALGNPTAPVWRGELQCKGLGMAVEVWDDDGQRLSEGKGELVCSKPFPSMPLGFWKDEDGSRFRAAYFERFPGVWAHGDYAEETAHGGLIIHGRSDAVLNPGGVRIGTAEIYRQVEKVEAVLESLAIGQQWQGDVRVVLFVRLRDGVTLDAALEAEIRQVIRANATPRHVPAKIIAVSDIPRTRSGKIVELAVRNDSERRLFASVTTRGTPAPGQEQAAAQLEVNGTSFTALVEERGLDLADVDLGDVGRMELGQAGEPDCHLGTVQRHCGPAEFAGLGDLLVAQRGCSNEQGCGDQRRHRSEDACAHQSCSRKSMMFC